MKSVLAFMKKQIALPLSIIAFGASMSCGDSTPTNQPDPVMTEISGTISFLGSLPPDGRINVAVWADWPTQDAPLLENDFDPRGASADYKFEDVAQRTYAAITAAWSPDDMTQDVTVIGVYWAFPDSVGADGSETLLGSPTPVTISSEAPVASGLDFTADFGLVN
mgnify:CR=1 FL=1